MKKWIGKVLKENSAMRNELYKTEMEYMFK